MTHDPICPNFSKPGPIRHTCNICDLIAKARADERKKAAERVTALAWQAAKWDEPRSVIAIMAASIGMGEDEPELQEKCYECAGEAESYTLAIRDAIAAVRSDS